VLAVSPRFSPRVFSSGRKVSLMVMLLALMLLWYSPQFKISGTLDIDASLREAKIPEITRFDTYTAYNEFLPKAALGKTFYPAVSIRGCFR